MNWWNSFYKNNKAIVWAAAISIVICLVVLLKVKDEVTRFTLIMPVFAGFILFSILITADEELEDEEPTEEKVVEAEKEEKPLEAKKVPAKSKKKKR